MAWPLNRGLASLLARASLALTLLWPASSHAAVFYPESYTLANGLQVVVVHNKLSPALAMMVWYKVGAMDDPDGQTGVAHYLEHMMFKGTDNLPTGRFSEMIAAQGGDENAYTTHDTTTYHEVIMPEKLGLVMQMEADRMSRLRFDEQEAASELSVVLSERQQRTENSPQGLFAEQMMAALYPGHPYGRPVIGWREDLEQLTMDKARTFYRNYYRPDNAILVLSGNVNSSEALALAAATFGRIEPDKPRKVNPQTHIVKTPATTRVERQDARVKQALVTEQILLPKLSKTGREAYAMDVLAEVLSGGEVGLLYKEFVLKRRLASSIDVSFSSTTRGPAVVSWSAVPAPDVAVRNLENKVKTFLAQLKKKGLPPQEIVKAKQRLEDSATFARDRLLAPAQILGEVLAVGQSLEDVENWPLRIRSVMPAEVENALALMLSSTHNVTGILEPAP